MRLFRRTTAEYTGARLCGNHRGVVAADFSWFDLLAAAAAAVPLWIYLLLAPWSLAWYSVFGVFAAELLLVFVTAPFATLLVMLFKVQDTNICTQCGALMFFASRHFDPLGYHKPCSDDLVILVALVAENAAIWAALLTSKL